MEKDEDKLIKAAIDYIDIIKSDIEINSLAPHFVYKEKEDAFWNIAIDEWKETFREYGVPENTDILTEVYECDSTSRYVDVLFLCGAYIAGVSLDGGKSFHTVNDLTDDEIAYVIDDIGTSDFIKGVKEAKEKATGESSREWLSSFLQSLRKDWVID